MTPSKAPILRRPVPSSSQTSPLRTPKSSYVASASVPPGATAIAENPAPGGASSHVVRAGCHIPFANRISGSTRSPPT